MQIICEVSELKNSSALSADDCYWDGVMILHWALAHSPHAASLISSPVLTSATSPGPPTSLATLRQYPRQLRPGARGCCEGGMCNVRLMRAADNSRIMIDSWLKIILDVRRGSWSLFKFYFIMIYWVTPILLPVKGPDNVISIHK